LTFDEISDLAAVEPARMKIYTELVFSGEREMLRWVYPMSLAAIRRLHGVTAAEAREFDYELTRDLHRFRPWRKPSVRLLAMNFQAFVNERRGKWPDAWPGLRELIDFERTDLEVYYAWDPEHRPLTPAEVEGLAGLSVEALMETPLLMPGYVALRRYGRDLPAWARRWREEQTLPDDLDATGDVLLGCGRAIEGLHTDWLPLEEADYRLLLRVPRDAAVSVNDLATAFLEATPERGDERALFEAFLGRLVRWLRGGLLIRPASD